MGHVLEIASNSVASALAAQRGGADRIELFDNLAEGGTTPSFGSIALAREELRIPLFVLIRPRPGDFHYDALERELMLRDIQQCRALGCDGVVIGALDADGNVDVPLCRELVRVAGSMQVTFHRAFDAARDLSAALEDVIDLGCQRVLSSGGQASAEAGADTLAALVNQASGRISVMAGAGIKPGNIASVAQATGCRELHASAKGTRRSAMRFQNPALVGLSPDWVATDADEVAALRAALASIA
ncbi:copper homeostasis protein CutC [Stenotrophomonas sp. PS02289]|uniref:copper homeostasis protein CutC n=1 Tax=Stenotrophomonas sp. PS02289 TaxID=2991422 RepID=UPI00249BDB7B|nr:copper homeostasis protein CutC [Stenotrophomonas sp. PS02289]